MATISFVSFSRHSRASRVGYTYCAYSPDPEDQILRIRPSLAVDRSLEALCYQVYCTWFLRENEVEQLRARLVHGWVTIKDYRTCIISPRNYRNG